MTISITLRWYLPVFLFLYLLIAFVLPSWRVYRKTGINPVTFGKTDNAHDFIGRWMKWVTGLMVAAVLLFSLFPQMYSYLLPFWYLERTGVQAAGLIWMHIALIWIMLAQYQMSHSWRIGIDEKHSTALVTSGLFRFSRNPIFLGMLASVWGLFAVLPNAITLLAGVTCYILIQIQIRLEEDHLHRQHGLIYEQYRKKVRRLI